MAVRTTKRKRYREQRKQSRRNLIARTARIWTKLYREATQNLKAITHNWLKKFLKQAEQEIASGYVSDIQELPSKFTQTLERTLRQALAQGYWLNHVYVQELRHAKQGTKYHGRINLSDKNEEEKLIEVLQAFMNEEVSDEWQEVIPESAVNWLKDYVPKLAGVLSADVLEKTREVIRGSMMTGSTLQERMKALRESSDVLLRMTDARIETIARTEITRADSMGRLIEMKGNDDVIGVEFSAIMDDRTTEMCAERHGLVMRLDDPRLPENTPPLHFRCRSLLLSLTVYDYPDGLLTSHEFDEVPSGIQRESDAEAVRLLLNSDVKKIASEIIEAHTIDEANMLAMHYGLAKEADFDGIDIKAANVLIKRISEFKKIFWDFEPLQFIGSMKKRPYFDMKDSPNAQFSDVFNAIGLNPNKFSTLNIGRTISSLKNSEKIKWYPLGCGTIEATCDHEIGHWLCRVLNAQTDDRILTLYREYYRYPSKYAIPVNGIEITLFINLKMANELSGLANKNPDEFVAEAFAEVRNNASSRELSNKIMQRVLEIYFKEYKH